MDVQRYLNESKEVQSIILELIENDQDLNEDLQDHINFFFLNVKD